MTISENCGYKIIWKASAQSIDYCVLALGCFDGVHIAHRELIEKAKELKEALGAAFVGAWSFEGDPSDVLFGRPTPFILSPEKKVNTLLECGLDFVILGDFRHFMNVSPVDFVNIHLKKELFCRGAVCGFNYTFGKGGAGHADDLETFFGKENVMTVPQISVGGVTVSSTAIRGFIASGDMESAARFLGKPFSLVSEIEHGKMLGRELGFPTANQCFPCGGVIPHHGIYATRCTTEDGATYIGVSNVGVRPTIDDSIDSHTVNCETFLLDFDRDIYGEVLKVEFFKLLREEKRFASLDELKNTISNDVKNAAAYFDRPDKGI